MKHVVIVAHPNPDSFTLSVARAYCEAVQARGEVALMRDLYRMGFDPCLKAHEIPRPGFEAAEDVKAERALIRDAKVFAFVYPLWFNAPPAMLKGYVDRVFTMGFGYGPIQGGGNQPLLTDCSMISFTSSGAPMDWLEQDGTWNAIREVFDTHVARVCGLRGLGHIHFGGVVADLPQEVVQARLDEVRDTVARLP